MLQYIAMSAIVAQVAPPPAPLSMLGWIVTTISFSSLLMLLAGSLIFIGAYYLIATKQRPAALASYMVLLPLPVLISLGGWLKGSIASLVVIANTPGLELTTSDIAGGLAESLLWVFIALLVSAPSYFVIAFGLLARTLEAKRGVPATA